MRKRLTKCALCGASSWDPICTTHAKLWLLAADVEAGIRSDWPARLHAPAHWRMQTAPQFRSMEPWWDELLERLCQLHVDYDDFLVEPD